MNNSVTKRTVFLLLLFIVSISCDEKLQEISDNEKLATRDSITSKEETSEAEMDSATNIADTLVSIPKVYSKQLMTQLDFENSLFFEKYKCNYDDSWKLLNGSTNHAYNGSGISIDLSILNEEIKHMGIIFYNKYTGLTEKDVELIDDLIDAYKFQGGSSRLKSFIKKNIEKSVQQIKEAKLMKMGKYTIWAGKVIQQTLVIEKK